MNIRSIVCSCVAVVSAFCQAETKTFAGESTVDAKDWFLGDNWSGQTVPTASDDVEISGKTVNVTQAVEVASLTLASKATLNVTARPLADTTPFATSQAAAMAALWANRLVVKVTGALTIPSGCTLKPANDKLTGELVAFEVGSADIAGTVDARDAGWAWTALGDKTLPSGAFKQHPSDSAPWYYTFAFGSTKGDKGGYNWGTSHGGKGSGTSREAYGYAAAPFMPGSPSSLYSANYGTRGGGSVVIHATGAINLTGSILATGNSHGQNAGPSGGGVWLAANSIVRSDASLINANGTTGMNGNQGQGGGGRVCLTLGANAAELAALAAGTIPETITVTDLVAANVTVAEGHSGSTYAKPGTVKEALSANLRTRLTVQSDAGMELVASGVTWGETVVDVGTAYDFAAPEFGFAVSDPSNVRKAFTGYVISNRTAEVERSATRAVSFVPAAGEGPYTLTWLTDIRETRTAVNFIGGGAGTVTVAGVGHTETFDVWAAETDTVTLTAAAAAGSTFVEYECADLPGGYTPEATLALSAATPHAVNVMFVSGRIKRTFVGTSAADLADPTKWSPAGVPDATQEAYFTNKTITATTFPTYAKLVISGGTFTIGGTGDPRTGFTFAVGDELTVTGGAKVYFYAKEFSDLTSFTDKTTATAEIWKNRSVVSVGGKFTVAGGATVYLRNDPVTGAPVVFEVGSFDLAADGTVNATGGGWQWRPTGSRTFPDGIKKSSGSARIDNVNYDSVFTLSFSPGSGYSVGGAHGGYGAAKDEKARPQPYGYRAAPFLPGSTGGTHKNDVKTSHGGGTVCVLASGAANLAGKIYANADHNSGYSGAAGGSVWIVASEMTQGDTLAVEAKGSSTSNANYKPGGGGRVSFMAGVSASSATFTQLVAGAEPEVLNYDALAFVGLSVKGASSSGTTECTAGDGTALSVYDPSAFETVTVAGEPLLAVSTGVAYGTVQALPGERAYAVTDWGYDPANTANVRFRCGGWVVSNATAEVASGVTSNTAFTVVKGEGPYTLTWKWTDRETRTVVTPAPALGAIECGGTALTEETIYWVRENATLTLDAVPDTGCALTKWSGSVRGNETATQQVLSGATPHAVTAYFHDSASSATRYWKKGAKGDFYAAANWVGDVVPGYGDTAVVSNGTCQVADYLRLAGLVVTNAASVEVRGADEMRIAGDLTVGGTAKLHVYARALDATHTFATGTTRVRVGGALRLVESGTLYPHSDALSGGSARFDVGSFVLAEGATVNADTIGWAWLEYTGTPAAGATTYSDNGIKYQTFAWGRGWSYGNGGSYATNANWSSGPAYGWANAPVHPGSPNGIYSNSTYPGGGLVRIHATGAMTVEGTITADGSPKSTYGGSSGGGIWLTAKDFAFGEAAVLRARGGTAGYQSNGSGGRIAIGLAPDAQRIDDLAETGMYPGLSKRRVHDEAYFREQVGNAAMTIDVHSRPGSGQSDKPGTFVFLDATRTGTMILVR